jgi:hypothetical protein
MSHQRVASKALDRLLFRPLFQRFTNLCSVLKALAL